MVNKVIINKNMQLYGQKILKIVFKKLGRDATTPFSGLILEKFKSNLEKAGEKMKSEHKNCKVARNTKNNGIT